MSSKHDLQIEALNELLNYSESIIPATEMIIKELRNDRKEDTEEFFNLIVQGINWEIEVFNCCESLINNESEQIDKVKMADAVVRLGRVMQEKDSIKMAACLEVDFLPFLKTMEFVSMSIAR